MNNGYPTLIRFTAVFIISLCWLQGFSQWTALSAPRGRHLHGAHIKDIGEYLVVGGNLSNDSLRIIYTTTDNGQNWDIQDTVSPWYQDVHFPSAQTGYVVGYNGIIKKTTDGGANWTQITTVTGNARFRHYNGVYFLNDNTGFIVGGNETLDSVQTILKTTDGGASWSIQRDNPGFWLKEIYMADANTGYAVGSSGVILKTVNGGINWNALTLPGNTGGRSFNAVYFHTVLEGIAVGGNQSNDSIRTIIRTIDGGANWDILSDNIAPWLNDVNFIDSSKGYAVGDRGSVLTTTDGGQTWSPVTITGNDTFNLNAVEIYNHDHLMLVGDNAKILVYQSIMPTQPIAITEAPTHLRDSSAVLNGTVNASGTVAAVSFEYGPSLSFGSTINANPDTVTGNTNTSVSAPIQFTTFNVNYYYRVKAVTSTGTVYGDTMQFFGGNDIPNWDFEYWDTVSRSSPAIWATMGEVSEVTSYNGSKAVRFTGGAVNDVGVILIGNFDSGGPGGGTPFADRPDSVKGYFNYNIATGDTAYVLVLFKKAGNIFSQNMFPITGSSGGSFVPLSFLINYGAPDMPDSLIIAVVSGNVNTGGNPNSVMTVDDITFTGTPLTVPNGDMEQWATLTGVYLQSWRSNSDNIPYLGEYMHVEQVTDRVHGRFAARLQNNPNEGGTTFLEARDYNGFPVNVRHVSFHGYLKWAPVGNDTLIIQITMKKNGSWVGGAYYNLTTPMTSWESFSVPITYNDPAIIPDSAVITIRLDNQVTGNSVAYVDYLSFDGLRDTTTGPVGIDDNLRNAFRNIYLKVFPNPTGGVLNLEFINAQSTTGNPPVTYTVLDISGRVVHTESENIQSTGLINKQLDLTALTPGIYFINITGSTLRKTMKIVLQ